MKRGVLLCAIVILLVLVSPALALDNSGGGVWKRADIFPFNTTIPTTTQYCIVINNNYINITNTTGVLKTSLYDPYFWSTVAPNGSDIRITNQNEQLYFWIEYWNSTTHQAKIWVNVTTGSTEIKMYYGNSLATTSIYDNENLTFPFCDEFNGVALNTSKWNTTYLGTIKATEANGYLELDTGGTTTGAIYVQNIHSPGYVLVMKAKDLNTYTAHNILFNYLRSGSTGYIVGLALTADEVAQESCIYGSTVPTITKYYTQVLTDTDTYKIELSIISPTTLRLTAYDLTTNTKVGTWYFTNTATGEWDYGIFTFSNNLQVDYFRILNLADPVSFKTPSTQLAGASVSEITIARVRYNEYNITGELMINNSTALIIPNFVYVPSNVSSTGFLATGSTVVPGAANITIYLDSNLSLNQVICNGTLVTPTYLGTYTSTSGEVYKVFNFTSPSAGELIVTANTTPIIYYYNESRVLLFDTPNISVIQENYISNVNSTYGINISIYTYNNTTLGEVEYNGSIITTNLTFAGTTTINNRTYNKYTITEYSNGDLFILTNISNLAYNTKIYVGGDTNYTCALVGEPIQIIPPTTAIIDVDGSQYNNTTALTTKFMSPTTARIGVEIFNTTSFQFGLHTFKIPVVWGRVNLTEVGYNGIVNYPASVYNENFAKITTVDNIYYGNNEITIYYLSLPIKTVRFFINHANNGMNITVQLNTSTVKSPCYNITIASPSEYKMVNLNKNIPFGKFAINHSGEVIIRFSNNSPATVSVTGNSYSYYPPYLYVYGSGNATITAYYKLRLTTVSALGIPLSVDIKVNNTKMVAYGTTDKVLPANRYLIEFPSNVNGFLLKNINLTKAVINLTTNTALPPAEYKVPTHINLEAYKVNTTSFKFPFPIPLPIPLGNIHTKQTGQMAYISGTLLNWYDSPVPNANVTVKIISLKTGYTIEKTVNTGNTGTFDVYFNVTPGVNYSITAVYNGSPVYVGSTEKIVVAGGALPPAPQRGISISTVMVLALTITVVCAGVAAVAYYAHKKRTTKAMMEMEKKARFFRRVK